MNYRIIAHILGRLILLLGAAMFVCDLYSWVLYADRDRISEFSLLLSAGVCLGLAAALMGFGRGAIRQGKEILRKEAIAIVGLGWIFSAFLGALPFVWSEPSLTLAQAVFESASGFTTTGSSTMANVEPFSREILLWRATTQWLGGGGILVLFVALLSGLGVSSRSLFQHESTVQVSQGFYSRIREMAARLWQIYLFFTVVCILGLCLLGAPLYEAITYTFATLSTGGFAPHNASVAYFDSPWIHLWITLFMLIGGTNFLLLAWLLRGRFLQPWRDEEFRLYVTVVVVASLLVWLSLERGGGGYAATTEGLWIPAVDALFQTVSIMTTTGFATADYLLWPPAAQAIILLLFFIGGCVGSTAGSIKIQRYLILGKSLVRHIVHSFRPQLLWQTRINGRNLTESDRQSAITYITFSFLLMLAGIPLLAFFEPDMDLATVASSVLTTFTNVGPGFGRVGPMGNFSDFGTPSLYFLSLLMILGRLELFAILALFVPSLWRKY